MKTNKKLENRNERLKIMAFSLIKSLVVTILLYALIFALNSEMLDFLTNVSNGNITAVEFLLVAFPVIFIVTLMIDIGRMIVSSKK